MSLLQEQRTLDRITRRGLFHATRKLSAVRKFVLSCIINSGNCSGLEQRINEALRDILLDTVLASATKGNNIKLGLFDKEISQEIEIRRNVFARLIDERLRVFSRKSADSILDEIENSDIRTTSQAATLLRKKFSQLGLSTDSNYAVETIFRTHVQISFNATKYERLKSNENIWGFRYLTAGDERVRNEHAILDRVTLPKDDLLWSQIWPPNGWNCRCQIQPLIRKARIKRPRFVDISPEFEVTPDLL